MENMMKQAVYTGIGFALRTRDAVMELGQRLVSESSMDEEEGKRFVNDLVHQSEEARQRLSTMIQERAEEVVASLNLPTRTDVENLNARIAALEAEVVRRRSAGSSGTDRIGRVGH